MRCSQSLDMTISTPIKKLWMSDDDNDLIKDIVHSLNYSTISDLYI